jgi:hypothetical protein
VRPAEKLYIPGRGEIRLDEYRIHRAVQEYDERLVFGRNEFGDWCVSVMMPRGSDYPYANVIGFGTEIPNIDEVMHRVRAADTRRHGQEILTAALRHNEALRDPARRAADDGAQAAAEAIEWGHRKMGTHPNPRIFVPAKEEK